MMDGEGGETETQSEEMNHANVR